MRPQGATAHLVPSVPRLTTSQLSFSVSVATPQGNAFPLTSLVPFGTLRGDIGDKTLLVIARLITKFDLCQTESVPGVHQDSAPAREHPDVSNGWHSDGHGTHGERGNISSNLSVADSDLQCNCQVFSCLGKGIEMNTPAFREELRPTLKLSEQYEWMPDLLPRPDGVRFTRGILQGITLCMPVWALLWWVVYRHF